METFKWSLAPLGSTLPKQANVYCIQKTPPLQHTHTHSQTQQTYTQHGDEEWSSTDRGFSIHHAGMPCSQCICVHNRNCSDEYNVFIDMQPYNTRVDVLVDMFYEETWHAWKKTSVQVFTWIKRVAAGVGRRFLISAATCCSLEELTETS